MWLHICYLAVLLLSAVVGLLFRKHLKSRNLYLLPFYLLLVFLQELVAAVIAVSTGIIYNIYNPITTVFFSFLFTSIPFNRQSRKLIFGLLITYLTAVIVTFIFFSAHTGLQ